LRPKLKLVPKQKAQKQRVVKQQPWDPEYGYCKGLANHGWDRNNLFMERRGSAIILTMVCPHCTTQRVDEVHYASGNVIRRHYVYPKGYLHHGVKMPKAQIRHEFLVFLTKGK
jgi:hypothetical protein